MSVGIETEFIFFGALLLESSLVLFSFLIVFDDSLVVDKFCLGESYSSHFGSLNQDYDGLNLSSLSTFSGKPLE